MWVQCECVHACVCVYVCVCAFGSVCQSQLQVLASPAQVADLNKRRGEAGVGPC